MVILNLEIVNCYRCFENLMLNFLNNYILTIDKDENITSTKMYRICPALDRGIEWMCRCADDFLSVYMEMNQFIRFVDVGFNNLLQRYVPGFLVPGPYIIAYLYILNRRICILRLNQRSRNKALRIPLEIRISRYTASYCPRNSS